MVVEDMPVGLVFQSYHLMVAMYGLIMLTSILVLVFTFKGGRIAKMRWAAVGGGAFAHLAVHRHSDGLDQPGEVGASPGWVYPSGHRPRRRDRC